MVRVWYLILQQRLLGGLRPTTNKLMMSLLSTLSISIFIIFWLTSFSLFTCTCFWLLYYVLPPLSTCKVNIDVSSYSLLQTSLLRIKSQTSSIFNFLDNKELLRRKEDNKNGTLTSSSKNNIHGVQLINYQIALVDVICNKCTWCHF